MNESTAVAIQVSRNVVVASVQTDLDEGVLSRLREDVLGRLHQTGSSGVILDLSGMATLDSHEFAGLRRIIAMIKIMGAQAVLVGLKPGIVSALIETGADVDGLHAAINLDAAFALLQPEPQPQPQPEPQPEQELQIGAAVEMAALTPTDAGEQQSPDFTPGPSPGEQR